MVIVLSVPTVPSAVAVKVMEPDASVCPVATIFVTGVLPTPKVTLAKAAVERPKNIAAAARRVFIFI